LHALCVFEEHVIVQAGGARLGSASARFTRLFACLADAFNRYLVAFQTLSQALSLALLIGIEDSAFAATGAIAGSLLTSLASEFASWAVRLAVNTLTSFTLGGLSEDLCVRLAHGLASAFETVVSHVGLTTFAN